MLDGYKTYIGAAIEAACAALTALGYIELADTLRPFGRALMAFGFGHKISKIK